MIAFAFGRLLGSKLDLTIIEIALPRNTPVTGTAVRACKVLDRKHVIPVVLDQDFGGVKSDSCLIGLPVLDSILHYF